MTSFPKCKIVTVADRRFLPAACCVLISMREHLPASAPVSYLLAGVDIGNDDLEKANRFLLQQHMQPCVQSFSSDELLDDRFYVNDRVTKAGYLRLVLDSIVSAEFDRVLYLDADTRVLAPLEPLLLADLERHPFAAAHDTFQYHHGKIDEVRKRLGMPATAEYFNSGVMLFDWKLTLKTGFLADVRNYAASHPDKCIFHDQDALNAVAGGCWKLLDPRWNLNDYYYSMGGKKAAWIKHYTGTKPWTKWRRPIWKTDSVWFEKLLSASPWPEAFEKQTLLQKLVMAKQHFQNTARNHRRAVAYRFWPFLMSAEARRRAEKYLKLNTEMMEEIVNQLISESNGAGSDVRHTIKDDRTPLQ